MTIIGGYISTWHFAAVIAKVAGAVFLRDCHCFTWFKYQICIRYGNSTTTVSLQCAATIAV